MTNRDDRLRALLEHPPGQSPTPLADRCAHRLSSISFEVFCEEAMAGKSLPLDMKEGILGMELALEDGASEQDFAATMTSASDGDLGLAYSRVKAVAQIRDEADKEAER